MISNISKQELTNINTFLPDFKKVIEDDETFIEKGIYKKVFISVFDHWLKEDEVKYIFVDNNENELIERRRKFRLFIEELFILTDLYSWKYKRHYRFFIKKPNELTDVFRLCDFEGLTSNRG